MENIEDILHNSLRALGEENYDKFLNSEIVVHWDTLVDENIRANVRPVALEHGVLFVHSTNSAIKDQLKFFAEDILDALNSKFGKVERVVKEIRPAKPFQVAAFKERTAKPAPPKIVATALDDISLTDEETARCEMSVQKIADEDLRAVTLQTLLLRAKAQKFKLADGWHKCKTCDALCAAGETFCEVCRLRELEKIRRKLFEIFYDTPWLTSEEARKIFTDKFPNLRDRCPPDFVNSTRTSLIQLLAGRLTLDEDNDGSNEILRLVMLERRLPPEKVTPAIIRRTLNELHFNFASPTRFPRYKFSKFRNLKSNA